MHQSNYKIQDEMLDPIIFIAKYEADMMYYHQATKKSFQKKLREAMVKELNNHTRRKDWKVVTIKEVPTGTRILDAIE